MVMQANPEPGRGSRREQAVNAAMSQQAFDAFSEFGSFKILDPNEQQPNMSRGGAKAYYVLRDEL